VTITHVDRDHLADLEVTVSTLTMRCSGLEAELFAAEIVHATAERELRETRDLLAAYRVTAAAQQEWIEKRSGVERREPWDGPENPAALPLGRPTRRRARKDRRQP
jgi:hypothetical protein